MVQDLQFTENGSPAAEALFLAGWDQTALGPVRCWPNALRDAARMMLDNPLPQCVIWGPAQTTICNPALLGLLGPQPAGRMFRTLWPRDWTTLAPLLQEALAGRAPPVQELALTLRRGRVVHVLLSFSPLRCSNGAIRGAIGTLVDVTDRVHAERQARLRNQELMHRLKNVFAVVSVLARQSFRNAATPEVAQTRIMRRLSALGEAQKLLAHDDVNVALIGTVAEHSLAPFRQGLGSIRIGGPPLELTGRQVLALALALNELATNATKYGALSTPMGKVDLGWSLGDGLLRLWWREREGPPVPPPGTEGLGSVLIRQSLASEFAGTVQLDYEETGVVCLLTAPLPHCSQGPC